MCQKMDQASGILLQNRLTEFLSLSLFSLSKIYIVTVNLLLLSYKYSGHLVHFWPISLITDLASAWRQFFVLCFSFCFFFCELSFSCFSIETLFAAIDLIVAQNRESLIFVVIGLTWELLFILIFHYFLVLKYIFLPYKKNDSILILCLPITGKRIHTN